MSKKIIPGKALLRVAGVEYEVKGEMTWEPVEESPLHVSTVRRRPDDTLFAEFSAATTRKIASTIGIPYELLETWKAVEFSRVREMIAERWRREIGTQTSTAIPVAMPEPVTAESLMAEIQKNLKAALASAPARGGLPIYDYRNTRVIFSEHVLDATQERLFPESKNRSARIRKKLVKRHGGEFRRVPAIWLAWNGVLYAHPSMRERLIAAGAREERQYIDPVIANG